MQRGDGAPDTRAPVGQCVTDLEYGRDIAFDVELAGNVRTSEAELAWRSYQAPKRIAGPDDELGA